MANDHNFKVKNGLDVGGSATIGGSLTINGSISGSIDYSDITNPPVIDNSVDYINSASFNTSNGILTLSGIGRAGATVDLDNRYLTSYTETDTLATVCARGNTTNSHIFIEGGNSLIFDSQGQGLGGDVALRANGEAFEIYEREDGDKLWLRIEDDPAANNSALKVNSTIGMATVWHAGNFTPSDYLLTSNYEDNYVDSVTFNTSTGVLTLGRTGSLPDLTVDLDGKYAESNHVHSQYMLKYNGASTADYDTLLTNGIWRNQGGLNGPEGTTHSTGLVALQDNGTYGFQLFSDTVTNASPDMYFRNKSTVWGSWNKLWHSNNLNPVTGLTHDTVNTELDITFADGTTQSLDLSQYIDDTNLARVVSGSHIGSGIVRFTRDDSTTFDVDFSDFFDDTNLARIVSASWNTSNGVLTLTRNDSSTVTVDLDGRYYNTGESDGRYVRKTGDTMSGNLTIRTSTTGAKTFVETTAAGGQAGVDFKNPLLHSRLILDNTNLLRIYNQTSAFNAFTVKNTGDIVAGTDTPLTIGGQARITSYTGGVVFSGGLSNNDMFYIRRQGTGEFCWQTYQSGNAGNIQLQPYGGTVAIGKATGIDTSYKLDMGGHIDMNANHIHHINEAHFTSGTRFKNNSSSTLEFRSNSSSAAQIFLSTNGTTRGSLYADNGNNIGILDQGGNWGIRHTNDQGTSFLNNNNALQASIGSDLVGGSYGSMVVHEYKGGWAGYSIDNDWVFMSNGTDSGIYNDNDNEWAINCARNGAVTLYNNGASKFNTISTGVNVAGHIKQAETIRPDVKWGASGATTGQVQITLPGTATQYDMVNIHIDVYEYNSSAGSQIVISGHNWTSGWFNTRATVIGGYNKPIYLGRNDTDYFILLGDVGSGWNYASVNVTKVTTSSFYNVTDWSQGWAIQQSTTALTLAQNTGNLNTTTSETLRTRGIARASSFRANEIYVNDTAGQISKITNENNMTIYSDHIIDFKESDANVLTAQFGLNGAGNFAFGGAIDASYRLRVRGNQKIDSNLDMDGGLTISGSLTSGGIATASNYKTGADNIILKGNSVGRSGIFFESEKDGTNINHTSDFGFIQYHAYGTGTTGEANELIIGVSNDGTDHVILNAPDMNGLKFRAGVSTTDYTIWHAGNFNPSSYLLASNYVDNYADSVAFNTSTGVLTIGRTGSLADLTVDLDGRYLTSETDNQTLSWNGTNGVLSISGGNSVDLDGRYLQSYSETDTLQSVCSRGNTTNTDVIVNGLLTATQKSFTIDHPTKAGYKLRYGSLEGPENGVYVRGRLKDNNVIELPDVWVGLVHEDSITVSLTAIGKSQEIWVEDIMENKVIVGGDNVNCFYHVFAERKDVDKLVTEFQEVE